MLSVWATTDLGAMAIKTYSAFPKVPALLEPHHQVVQCHIQDILGGGVLPLCRDAVSVFNSSSRLGHRTLVEGVLPLCRNAVSVFYRSSWLGHRTLIEGRLTFLQKCSRCILQSQPTGSFISWDFLPCNEKKSEEANLLEAAVHETDARCELNPKTYYDRWVISPENKQKKKTILNC